MALKSRKYNQMQITQIILQLDNNPNLWTDEYLNEYLKGEVIIGYLLEQKTGQFGVCVEKLNLYTIKPEFCNTKDTISASTLQCYYLQWLVDLREDQYARCFKNPPFRQWFETKENWVKKEASRLCAKYNRDFNETLSDCIWVCMKCAAMPKVYLGNLGYLSTACENEIKMDHRYRKNRLMEGNPAVISLDAELPTSEGTLDGHDIYGTIDPEHAELDFECKKADILSVLQLDFSEREIDQILNNAGFLPNNIYRRLLAWRKENKRSDYGL